MDYGSDSYTTAAQVQTYLNRTLSASETSALGIVIPATSRWIDRALGTTFSNITTPATKHFRGGFRNINIQPCQSITAVSALNPYDMSVWYTYTAPLEYIAEPYDLPVKKYLQMRRNEFTGHNLKFPGDDVSIAVTALFTEYDFANNKYPEDIVLLCNHVSAVWLQNAINADGVMRESIEGHEIIKKLDDILEKDPMVQRVLHTRQDIWLED